MVAPELDGGVLTGRSSDFAAGLGEDDGEVDEGLRMTANSISYSSVLGVAPLLGFVVPSSGEMRTRSKSTNRAPTAKIGRGIRTRMMRRGQRERERERERAMGLPTELKVINGDAASASIPTTTARIEQGFATRVLLGGRRGGASSQEAMGGLFIGRG